MAFPGAHEFARRTRQAKDSQARAYLESLAGYERLGGKPVDECSFARGTAVRVAEATEAESDEPAAEPTAESAPDRGVLWAQLALQEELDTSQAAPQAAEALPRGSGLYGASYVGAPDYAPAGRRDPPKQAGSAVAALRARVAKLADTGPATTPLETFVDKPLVDMEPPPLPAQRGVVLGAPELRPDPEATPPEPEKEKETGFMELMSAWSAPEPGKRTPAAKPPMRERRVAKETGDEKAKREMREATQTSPLLAQMRLQLAEAKVSKPPPEYASFCQQLRDHGEDLRHLPIAEVTDVKRARRVPSPLKEPLVVELRGSWRPRRWSLAYWSHESGGEEITCFRRWPPLPSDGRPGVSGGLVRVDEFARYAGLLRDVDPACLEENYLVYPRFFVGGWSPFAAGAEGRALWEEDLQSGRQLWSPPGLEDLTKRWVKMFCGAINRDWKDALSSLDRVQLGPPGAVTRLHVEDSSAHVWYGQVQGRRAFVLFPPSEGANLYAENDVGERAPGAPARHSPVDVLRPSKSLARYRESKARVAVLQGGEVLVVPTGWWLYSVTLEASVTLCRRFWNTANKAGMSDEFARVFIPPGMAPDVAAALTQHIETFRIQIQQDSLSDDEG